MVKDVDSLKEQAEWDGAKGHSRHKLLALLSRKLLYLAVSHSTSDHLGY